MQLAAAAVAAICLAACGSVKGEVPGSGVLTPEQARAFDEFPLYFAGERVDGLPLVAILRRKDTADYMSFVYGDCLPAGYDQGCAPPAEIQVWPGSRRSLEAYDFSLPGAPEIERATVRGAPAAFLDGGTRLELFTGAATVVVFSDARARVLRIAAALRCLTAPTSEASQEALEC